MFSLLQRTKPLYLICIALLAAAIVYVPHLSNSFVTLDDGLLITKNPAIQELTLRSLKYVFTSYDPELYVPLTLVSYQIEHAFFGLNSFFFHLTNLLLHLGNIALVFGCVYYLSKKNRFVAFLCALLFALHPLNTETVLWAAARKDVLASFFGLSSVLIYIQYLREDRRWLFVVSIFLFALALLSKVSVILLPIVLVLIDFSQKQSIDKRSLKEKIPFLVLSILFGIIALIGKTRVIASSGPLDTILLAFKSSVFYLQKIFVPDFFSVIYPQYPGIALSSVEFFLPVIIVLGLITFAIILRKRSPVFSACVFAYFLLIAANFTNFYKNGFLFFASDRYAYLGSIAVFFLIAWGIDRLIAHLKNSGRSAAIVVLGILMIFLAWRSTVQAFTWKNSIALYRNVIAHYPESAMAHNNLGDALKKENQLEEADLELDAALALDPSLLAAHVNKGDLQIARGNLAGAITQYRLATASLEKKTQLNVDEVAAYYVLAQALEQSGDLLAALNEYETAAKKAPQLSEAQYNLGLQYQKLGRSAEGISSFLKAVELNPQSLDARYHLAAMYGEAGMLPQAAEQLRAIVAVNPGYQKAADHLRQIEGMMR